MRGESQLLNARSVRWLDAGVAAWVVVWIVLGVLVWHDIGAQAQLSDDVIKIGAAVESTGEALGVVGGLPLVGERIGEFADRIQSMGAEVQASGQDSRSGIERAAVIAGLGVGVLPAALVLLLYLPARLRWKRYTGAIAAALPGAADDPAFDEYLARRAVAALPWGELRAITPDPWGDIGRGECRALADAELERLGLRRP
jgi:hypothetical protein